MQPFYRQNRSSSRLKSFLYRTCTPPRILIGVMCVVLFGCMGIYFDLPTHLSLLFHASRNTTIYSQAEGQPSFLALSGATYPKTYPESTNENGTNFTAVEEPHNEMDYDDGASFVYESRDKDDYRYEKPVNQTEDGASYNYTSRGKNDYRYEKLVNQSDDEDYFLPGNAIDSETVIMPRNVMQLEPLVNQFYRDINESNVPPSMQLKKLANFFDE